ncbi:MAG: hypothetical protein U5K73_11855 [Halofilum sp. (in: g-proteobacteria)]|nr:hypothetical protein [Halofilum sp. (in: g-proteobacteria)]
MTGETVFVSGTSTDPNAPRLRARANVPADNAPGGVSLAIPPGTPVQVGASGRNGTRVRRARASTAARANTIDIDFVLAPPPEPG